jgi:hypothetical protein
MKVSVLRQYLHSLLGPLRAGGAAAKLVDDLERTCQQLDAFADRDVADLAAFLQRAKAYEEQGHWPTMSRSAKPAQRAKTPAPSIPELADRLRMLANTPDVESHTLVLDSLTVAQLRELIGCLGITGSFKKKEDGIQKVRSFLLATAHGSSTQATTAATPPQGKVASVVEALNSLRARAEFADAPFEQIEAELLSLQGQLDAREAIAAARALGVIRTISTRAEALEEIRRKVFEVKLARESIMY